MYGPEYPLQSDRYFRSRILPKLLDEASEMFRFHSCKFNVELHKTTAARVVFNKEFSIMNCFTLEASMHAYINKERRTVEFKRPDFCEMGRKLGTTLLTYADIVDDDERVKVNLKRQYQLKKRKTQQ